MKVELLAPAGNLSKLKRAFYFGADAVYLGGKNFSLRTFADNFTHEELLEGIQYAHARGKKVYVTVNIFAHNEQFASMPDYFKYLQEIEADGAIIADAGVFAVAKEHAPKLELHISTQANITNKYNAEFWQNVGATRVVLARELSLKEIEDIHKHCPKLEIEAFVHGAMCMAYSGRCLLSNYLTGRNANSGACAQSCRRNYKVVTQDGEDMPIEEDEKGTYIFNSKDLNMIEHLDAMKAAGVDSFKIEGRMKSDYYLATVVNAYRRVLDGSITAQEGSIELQKAAHRDFTTAYTLGENEETINYDDTQKQGTRQFVADVLGYEDGKAFIEMRNRFQKGDILEILSTNDSFNKQFTVENIVDEKGNSLELVNKVQQKIYADCPYPLSAGDILRRV